MEAIFSIKLFKYFHVNRASGFLLSVLDQVGPMPRRLGVVGKLRDLVAHDATSHFVFVRESRS